MTNDTQAASVDERKEIEIKKILVPIDGSEYSLHAAQYATTIARNEKAQLFCIHVVTPRIPYGYATPATSSTKSRYYDHIKIRLNHGLNVRNMAKDEGIFDIKTEIFVDVKSIIESIIEYATQRNIDLIVIGTRGRTGLKRFFMGSVANGVVQHARCSVLVIR